MASIFICYRRDDSAGHAGRLYHDLREHFGREAVFVDIGSIEPGTDWDAEIDKVLASCKVLLAVVGKAWLTVTDASGRRRLFDPDDRLRREIVTAMRRGLTVIPVRVNGASLPNADGLPEDLKSLHRWQDHEITDKRWEYDVGELVKVLDKVLAHGPSAAEPPTTPASVADPLPEPPATHAGRLDRVPHEATTVVSGPPRSAVTLQLLNYVEANQGVVADIRRASPGGYLSLRFDVEQRAQLERDAAASFPEVYKQVVQVGRLLEQGNRLLDAVADTIRNKKTPPQADVNPELDWRVYLYDAHNQLLDHVNNVLMPPLASLHTALSQADAGREQRPEERQQPEWVVFNQPDLVPTGASLQGVDPNLRLLATAGEHSIILHNEGNSTPSDVRVVLFPAEYYYLQGMMPQRRTDLAGTYWQGRVDVAPPANGDCTVKLQLVRFPLWGDQHVIAGHTLYAPPEPDYAAQTNAFAPFYAARLTLTYRDRIGRKLASAFDMQAVNGAWRRVAGPTQVDHDLDELSDRAARDRKPPLIG